VREAKPKEAQRDDLEADVQAAIEACGGDARAAVRALVIANAFLEARCERMRSFISPGFARGKLSLLDLP
jgi:hypothetical protein